ncbi:MAG: nucleoside triphosphate pyrophosphohydrolase [Pseudomonadota bacterium]
MKDTRPDRPLPDRTASDALVFDRAAGLERLLEIMARLRAPDGCPWDREQTWESIAPYTIEEATEVAEAIAARDTPALVDELGDLLLQVVYHARIGEEAGAFTFDDVARASADKMLRRHPHVFGTEPGGARADPEKVDWEEIKAAERAEKGERRDSVLDDVPGGMPALARALKLTKRAAKPGFDWKDPDDVMAKVVEEAGELREEVGAPEGERNPERIKDEFGDLLFVIVNLGRHLGVDAEAALRGTNAKFERRFRAVEAALRAQGRTVWEADLGEMDTLWTEIKRAEKAEG